MNLESLAKELGDRLLNSNNRLVTAESCTGGWVSQVITSVSGSSDWFERGYVTYSNEAKHECLGVQQETLNRCGAVSEETAREMAEGALKQSHATVSLAVTGIAGPDGGSEEKPVGMVWFAWASEGFETTAECQKFEGDRMAVREQSVEFVLKRLLETF